MYNGAKSDFKDLISAAVLISSSDNQNELKLSQPFYLMHYNTEQYRGAKIKRVNRMRSQ